MPCRVFLDNPVIVISIQSIFAWLEDKRVFFICLLAGLVLVGGVVYSIYLGSSLRFLSDEAEYIALAKNLVAHKIYSLNGVQPTAYRPPGYPAVLSVLVMVGGDILHIRILNFLFLAGCIFLVGCILIQQGLRLGAIFGSLLIVAYPVLFYTSGTIYPQPLAAFLFLILLQIYIRVKLRPIDFIVGGIVLGLLILTVPTFLFAAFIILGWFLFYGRYQHAKWYLLSLAIASLMVVGWTVRNYSVFGAFFFVSTNSGENLLIGNSENTTPNAGTSVDISPYLEEAAGLGEVERDRFLNQQALNYIAANPRATLELYLQKLINYFNYRIDLVTASEEAPMRDLLMLVTYGPLLLVFVIRILALKFAKPTSVEVLFILLYITSAFVTAIFFTRIRFRLPFDYLLIMIVSMTLDRMVRFTLDRKTKSIYLHFLRLGGKGLER